MALGALVVALGAVAAVALAAPSPDSGPSGADAELAVRTGRAAAALADIHPADRSVMVLSEVAQRETSRVGAAPSAEAASAMTAFCGRAEGHLVSGTAEAAAARQMLSELVRQLRGGEEQHAKAPATPVAPPSAAEPPEEPREATVVGQNLLVDVGEVVEEASAVGGNLTVRGHVLGDAVAVGGNVHLEPSARVDGDVVSVGGQVIRDPGSQVGGEQTQVGPAALTRMLPIAATGEGGHHGHRRASGWFHDVVRTVGATLVMILVGLVILALAPRRTRAIMLTIRKRPGMSLLAGVLTLIIAVVASVLLAITLVGIVLIPFVLIGLAIVGVLGLVAAAHVIGEVLPGKHKAGRSSLWCMTLGIIVLGIIGLLPFGPLVVAVVSTIALGAVIISKVGANEPRQ